MIERAQDPTAQIGVVIVHSLSRAFRNLIDQLQIKQRLASAGVKFFALRDAVYADPEAFVQRAVLGLTNKLKSIESQRDTLRGMTANAVAGFSNGGRVPIGYRLVDAVRIGTKQKRVLQVDPVEAEIVRLAFPLADGGDGQRGPLGVKRIAEELNRRGYRSRAGNRFGR